MSPEKQRAVIAEACGWRKEYCFVDFRTGEDKQAWITPHGETSVVDIPNYLNDLNAMHKAEASLSHDRWQIFLGLLMGARVIPKLGSMEDFERAWRSTAAQRAEAFLRTVGKWEDE